MPPWFNKKIIIPDSSIINKTVKECQNNNKLYLEWEVPKLTSVEFRCERCAARGDLHAIHDRETLSEIVLMMERKLNPHGMTDKMTRDTVKKAVIDYHIENNISGVVLCRACRKGIYE